jgi:hypothetical protein
MAVPMSRRAYARERNCSERAVRKAIASGRIRPTEAGLIDPAQADENWFKWSAVAVRNGASKRGPAEKDDLEALLGPWADVRVDPAVADRWLEAIGGAESRTAIIAAVAILSAVPAKIAALEKELGDLRAEAIRAAETA